MVISIVGAEVTVKNSETKTEGKVLILQSKAIFAKKILQWNCVSAYQGRAVLQGVYIPPDLCHWKWCDIPELFFLNAYEKEEWLPTIEGK